MANESLTRRPTSTGNRRVYTLAFWIKRTTYSTFQSVFSAANTNNVNETFLYFIDGILRLYQADGAGSALWSVSTPQSIRDSSAMCHAVISVDTTQALSSDRVKIYINGVLSVISSATYPTINFLTNINTTELHKISGRPSGIQFFEGYLSDFFFVDGQALTPDVFGFYKEGKGYISAGSTQATDFRPGQWVPKTPRVIKTEINRRGGFGVNGFYLPMNDSNNFGADFHCDPNSIIKLNEELPQPRVGVATTASVGLGYTDALRADPYAANLVLALPFVSGGLSSGFGDYAPSIKGSGTQKTITTSNVSIASTASYYGSANFFNGTNGNIEFSGSDFNFGTNDFTVEMWVNSTTGNGTRRNLYWGGDAGGSDVTSSLFLEINASNQLRFSVATNGSYSVLSGGSISLNQWNHIALVKRRTTVTGYLNGVAVGIDTNCTGTVNTNANPVQIGGVRLGNLFGGYIQDLRIYNGVAKYTGGFDVPKPYTPVGIATWRAVPDTTANNFATQQPTNASSLQTLTAGNLDQVAASGGWNTVRGSIGISTGKYYWEVRMSGTTNTVMVGVDDNLYQVITNPSNSYVGAYNNSWSVYLSNGQIRNNTGSGSAYGSAFAQGDICMVALDVTNGKIYWGRNGTWFNSGDPVAGTNAAYTNLTGYSHIMPAVSCFDSNSGVNLNFGQNPTFSGNTTAGTFTDSNGKGLFKYQPPSGFLALCEDNLPTPAISNPGQYFKTVIYTGASPNDRAVTGIGFTPDLVWIKSRTQTYNHHIFDSVRGPARELYTNTTGAEVVDITGLKSFDSDGFSIGSNAIGDPTGTRVAWCWRAGAGTTSTNTNGTITSVVSVNQTAGFSIVSYNGNLTGSGTATVGHGLGKNPAMIITKARNTTSDWIVMHKSLPTWSHNMFLQLTNAFTDSSSAGTRTVSTSTFTTNYLTGMNVNGNSYVAYCWTEIEGFSKAFSYVGNGSADGPMVYLGLKPALIIIKRTNDIGNWQIYDSSRMSTNPNTGVLFPNLSNIEGVGSGYDIDFLSNGFKLRSTDSDRNASGSTYVGFAWAESPFQTSNSK